MKRPAKATAPARPQAPLTETDEMYGTSTWTLLSKVMRRLNAICQRLRDGEQCRNPSRLVHHLVSPRQDPALFLEPVNMVCLCEHCHTPEEGTPHWIAGKDFVRTLLPYGAREKL